jgi:hypothetical protein
MMINTLDEYIAEFSKKISSNIFSPYFSRLANLYFLNGQYEECITVCKTGLELYPDYQTAKIIMLKALIKLEYINEAETLIEDLEDKYLNYEIITGYRDSISQLKTISKQERIYYTQRISTVVSFDDFRNIIEKTVVNRKTINKDTLISHLVEERKKAEKELEFNNFKNKIDNFKFDKLPEKIKKSSIKNENAPVKETSETLHFLKIKLITETFAGLIAKQGYIKEAFNFYNILIKKEGANIERIMVKLTELERSLTHEDNTIKE